MVAASEPGGLRELELPFSRFINQTLHPGIYHGRGVKAPFFEGWYFKLVDGARETAWAVIPGIYKDRDPALDQAFVMVLDGRSQQVTYHGYPVSDFAAARDAFQIRVGPNLFAADFLTLNLPDLQGHLTFHDCAPWPVSWRAPGIMGWYAWFPMECYHGLVSMDHTIMGQLRARDTIIDFDQGRGYIEKDWGRNFPQTWVWLQANHFSLADISLTASVARIPFYGRVFPGFIIGLLLDGRLYRFTTYLGSTLERVVIDGDRVQITVHDEQHELQINAQRGPTALLPAPTPGQGMIPRVAESVGATVSIRLSKTHGGIIYEGPSAFAGMEIEGDTRILETA
jgi:hypothetical protein